MGNLLKGRPTQYSVDGTDLAPSVYNFVQKASKSLKNIYSSNLGFDMSENG